MARKRSGKNLSAEIRKYAEANPNAKPKAVAVGLAAAGIKVSPLYISTVLSNARRKAGKARRRKGGRIGADSVHANLILAKRLADQLGGVAKAQLALATLAKILDS